MRTLGASPQRSRSSSIRSCSATLLSAAARSSGRHAIACIHAPSCLFPMFHHLLHSMSGSSGKTLLSAAAIRPFSRPSLRYNELT